MSQAPAVGTMLATTNVHDVNGPAYLANQARATRRSRYLLRPSTEASPWV